MFYYPFTIDSHYIKLCSIDSALLLILSCNSFVNIERYYNEEYCAVCVCVDIGG